MEGKGIRSFNSRIKENQMRHIKMLQKSLRTLKRKATALTARLTMLQNEATEMTASNNELRIILEAAQRECLMDNVILAALKEEIQMLKILSGQDIQQQQAGKNVSSSSKSENED